MARPIHNISVGGSLSALATHYKLGTKGDEVVNAIGKRREDFTLEEISRYADYCVNDVELTYALFNKLKRGFPVSELLCIDQTLRMYTEPVIELDVPLLQQHLLEVQDKKSSLMQEVNCTVQDLMSNDKFASILQQLGVTPPRKTSLKTGKDAWAFAKTDKGMTDLLEHPDDRVQGVVTARLGVKSTIEETRTMSLIGVAQRGRLPIMLNYYGAHTGRYSGGDKMNLQNLPARGNNTIRRALKAPDGYTLISSDSSQIEARMVAWVAGQTDLLDAFAEGRDVYSEFASEVYGRTITKTDKVARFVGKTCILGLGYGMGAEKFRRTLEVGQGGISVSIELNEAERIVRLYRQKNWKIVQLWQRCGSALTGMTQGGTGNIHDLIPYDSSGITLPNKFQIKYPALRQTSNGFEYIADARTYRKYLKEPSSTDKQNEISWTRIYGGKVTENLVQALAAIVIREQMTAIGQHYHVAFQVHDEIIISTRDSDVDNAEQHLVRIMSTPPIWATDLPIACESGKAKNYGDT
jgi:DNA polymerase